VRVQRVDVLLWSKPEGVIQPRVKRSYVLLFNVDPFISEHSEME